MKKLLMLVILLAGILAVPLSAAYAWHCPKLAADAKALIGKVEMKGGDATQIQQAKKLVDELVCLRPMAQIPGYLEVYRKCLKDSDGRIRGLALKRLSEEGKQKDLESLKGEIGAFLNDPDMSIKEAALKIIRRRKWV